MIRVTAAIALPDEELHWTFIQSAGPGGQNVNKVATAAQLQFDTHSPSLPETTRQRLIRLAGKRINAQGVLTIVARRYRTQEQNRQEALNRLLALIRKAAEPPKVRRKTVPSRAAIARRLEAKRRRSEIKRQRRQTANEERS